MVKQIFAAITVVGFLSSCSTFKPLNFTSSKQVVSSTAPATSARFIDDISVTPASNNEKTVKPRPVAATRSLKIEEKPALKEETGDIAAIRSNGSAIVENASSVQLKYSVLMNTEVENLPNKNLLDGVDDWYGVRYRSGGNTKTGVDCSGFTVAVYLAVYGISLPRVSRDQYRISRKISTTELQEGDLVFFNTRGSGVSHVGVYLGNNKFIHASVSRGVMVSDLFESYYIQRFIGAGRVEEKEAITAKN